MRDLLIVLAAITLTALGCAYAARLGRAGKWLDWAVRHEARMRLLRGQALPDVDQRHTGPVPVASLVVNPDLERYRGWTATDATTQHQQCNRCRTGSTAFPCTCTRDCYAPHCAGGATTATIPHRQAP